MTETDRIRWEDKTPGNGDVYRIAHLGYIGTVEGAAFIIYTPDEMHADWLLSVRLVPGGTFFYDVSAEALKAEAEEWLAGFVSSLGAIFPGDGGYDFGDEDEDGEPLEVKYAPGRRVRYAYPDAGYPGEAEEVMKALIPGRVYTIGWADIGQSRTDLHLFADRKPAGVFNSVFFEPVDEDAAPAAAGKESPDA